MFCLEANTIKAHFGTFSNSRIVFGDIIYNLISLNIFIVSSQICSSPLLYYRRRSVSIVYVYGCTFASSYPALHSWKPASMEMERKVLVAVSAHQHLISFKYRLQWLKFWILATQNVLNWYVNSRATFEESWIKFMVENSQ